jgi:hypothetical protein
MSQRWFYSQDAESFHFALLVDHRGSSCCRLYDPESGQKQKEIPARKRFSDDAFEWIVRGWSLLEGLPGAKVMDIKDGLCADELNMLRAQAGLRPVRSGKVFHSPSSGGGMLDGFERLVDNALDLRGLGHRSRAAALKLSAGPRQLDGAELIHRLYDVIERNWDHSSCRSSELWRWKAMPKISEWNTSAEKTLEKSIVSATHNWVNQIPAASGLMRYREQTHTNVDLGHQVARGHYELIELKAGMSADTPLRAAFEIIGYGLLYCFARKHMHELDLPTVSGLLLAREVDLKVLGSRQIYHGYNFPWLEDALDAGLQNFARKEMLDLQLHFTFEAFPREFFWPGASDTELCDWLTRRERVYGNDR